MADPKTIYQIKVTLVGTKPPIWRRILVPGTTPLDQLHTILQLAMGWTNSHLHLFKVGEQIYGDEEYDENIDLGTKSESRYQLKKIAPKDGFRFLYVYDFGDNWEHSLLVEKILPAEKGKQYPACAAGKRACPPDDVGGVWGYEELLGAIADPKNAKNSELSDWIGAEFDPEEFDVEKVNDRFNHLKPDRPKDIDEATDYSSSQGKSKFEEKALTWAQSLNQEQADGFESLSVLRDMQSFLNYLIENRTVGTQSTGNLPLKAVRAICSNFAEPPVLDEKIGNHIHKLRSEYEVWSLFYIHILAEVSGLVTGGRDIVWRVTQDGKEFSQLLPANRVLFLLDFWWHLADWTNAFPLAGFDNGLPKGFPSKTLSCLLKLVPEKPTPYESFADELIKQSGLIWPIENQTSARKILHSAIERMVINPLVGFSTLNCTYEPRKIGNTQIMELATICLTQVGKEMLEIIE